MLTRKSFSNITQTKVLIGAKGGGIYYAPDGEALAIFPSKDKSGPKYSVGVGKWTVSTKGTRCFELTWSFLKDGKRTDKAAEKRCREHVVDGEGIIWTRDSKPKRGDWWKLVGNSKNSESNRFKKGNKHKSSMKKSAQQLGLKL
ncbi:DUF995 domain-containing protein [Shimia abyssi]|uniref:Uncharacterized protein DUF995 n=1 Tax=Shimia abyssi TaxID=1662395 RepID=A0A2P8FA15_9RHOB|nr:DUF995 domain-containing protein [Shimia abyssi]PSL18566.1 uncharacterized protein DUF995 [Shimia abyssi]